MIVTWDESDARSLTNQIPLMVVGADIKPSRSNQHVNHYGLLCALEDFYDLKPLGHSAVAAPASMWH
ncbi:MAG: hypothetical protein KGL98_11895 [Gammaproteobacteria bacterium]|nr:hypothetical protein [Gammaproteobacteria bacterium]MDE1984221.1 hypothetical protein [Gammaproteobacteria bacterium]MDE2108807.1 hypothetical protein [Gammaproteobacteria bacterium]MDE2461925.1 hypothetical protein [Gammaproteobacteria bacterium]